MAKGKSSLKYNKLLTARKNYFDGWGDSWMSRTQPSMGMQFPSSFGYQLQQRQLYQGTGAYQAKYNPAPSVASYKPAASSGSAGGSASNGGGASNPSWLKSNGKSLATAGLGALASVAASPNIGNVHSKSTQYEGNSSDPLDMLDPVYHIAGGRESSLGNGLSDAGKSMFTSSAAQGNLFGMLGGAILKVGGGLVNSAFGYSIDKKGKKAVNAVTDTSNNLVVDDSSNDALMSQQGNTVNSASLNRKKFKNGWFNKKGTKAFKKLTAELAESKTRIDNKFANAAHNTETDTFGHLMANYGAFGGPLWSGMGTNIGATGYDLASQYVQAKQTQANGQSNNLVSMPNSFQELDTFAYGGDLGTHGADFTNGMVYVNNGGSHESNPNEGVPMGIDPEGVPNLVEEGETIFNDYVFSRRIRVPKAIRRKYKLGGLKDMTFAEASKRMAKESEERPNDPISQRGLKALMGDLAMAQEMTKQEKKKNSYAKGGRVNKFANGDFKHKWEGWRYAPAVGLGLASLSDALGWTNKANYNEADAIIKLGQQAMVAPAIKWNPIGNYLTYKPLDRNYYLNQLAAQSGATRREILNTAAGNRAQAMAGLISADYNAGLKMGNLARQAEEYNLNQRKEVETFNRTTNLENSKGFLSADASNQQASLTARNLGLSAQMKGYEMRQDERRAVDAIKSANLSGFVTALGNIGKDNAALNARNFALASGTFGPINDEYMYLLTGEKPKSKAKGGKVKRRRKGLTY